MTPVYQSSANMWKPNVTVLTKLKSGRPLPVPVPVRPSQVVNPLVGSNSLTWRDFFWARKWKKNRRRRFRNAVDTVTFLRLFSLSISLRDLEALSFVSPQSVPCHVPIELSLSLSAFPIPYFPILGTVKFAPVRAYIWASKRRCICLFTEETSKL